ncbi:MAG: TIGR03084 family protein [Gammaproteobacteria bacterium]|nr:TIGR03084 family protein [Gammaproteobacteria bacterium]|tara:strand:- start:3225 stop:4025 length:801 start_codon:yes stop_codon:yes gene_type:complete
MEQAEDFKAECAALYELVADLSDAEFDQATAFKGWTLNNVFRHLHAWNQAANLTLTDEQGFLDYLKAVQKNGKEGGTLIGFEEQWLEGLSGAALRETWREYYDEVASNFGTADPSKRLKWGGPDMSARSCISARLMETWAHGQEVYDQLGVVRRNEDRIRNIVILGINTYGWTYAVREEVAPEPRPYVRLTAPSGEEWTFNDPSSNDLIEGAAEEFCQVVTQVRNIADTNLTVTGPNAADWMSKAQCFAGAAQPPPAPGTRTTRRA